MERDTGIIPQELDEEEEVSDEQLQRLGIKEYPENPEWVGGHDFWTGMWNGTNAPDENGNIWSDEALQEAIRQIENWNRRQRNAELELQYQQAGSLVFDYTPTRVEPVAPYQYWADVNPIVVSDDVYMWGAEPFPPEPPAEPELNLDMPNYENLQEMMRIAEESGEG